MKSTSEGIGDRYHRETKYSRDSLGGPNASAPPAAEPFTCYNDAVLKIPLPDSLSFPAADFWKVLTARRSQRDFSNETLSFENFLLLLFAVQGVTDRSHGCLFRTVPSAGALYPVETYVVPRCIASLDPGIYHLNVLHNCLELLRRGSFERALTDAALGQSMIAEAALTFVWTAVVNRSKRKYRERAYRYIYMDAGHIGQNLYLSATALGLGCCTIGAFFDDQVNAILGLDGFQETAIYMGVVGAV